MKEVHVSLQCDSGIKKNLQINKAIRGLGSVGGADKARLCVQTQFLM